jgi:guanylate kinase
VMDVTVPGSLAVLERMHDAFSVFLLPPSFAELRNRLLRPRNRATGGNGEAA